MNADQHINSRTQPELEKAQMEENGIVFQRVKNFLRNQYADSTSGQSFEDWITGILLSDVQLGELLKSVNVLKCGRISDWTSHKLLSYGVGLNNEMSASREYITLTDVWKAIASHSSPQSTNHIHLIDKDGGSESGCGCGCCKGIFGLGDDWIQLSGNAKDGYELIAANSKTRKIEIVLKARSFEEELVEKNLDRWKENGVIDFGETGRHWEGGVLDGCKCCCGYGKEYNDDNNLVYEGFMFGENRVCYGKEYRGLRDNKYMKNGGNGLVYEGGYLNGIRYGFGKLYNLNGCVEYEGEWIDNQPICQQAVMKCESHTFIAPLLMERFEIQENVYNDKLITTLFFPPLLTQLREIKIEYKCFQNVREFVLDGLERLGSVKICYDCFNISDKERNDGICRIMNCPNLRQLEIGYRVFADFKHFELSNVNSLQSIQFGDSCFVYVENCILKDLPSLQQVSFGGSSFRDCHLAQFENLPKLTTISFNGYYTLQGDCDDNRQMVINGYRSYNNTLIMKDNDWLDLPSLTTIQGNSDGIHYYMGRVILENIPNLTLDNIHYGRESFHWTADLQATNAEGLDSYINSKTDDSICYDDYYPDDDDLY